MPPNFYMQPLKNAIQQSARFWVIILLILIAAIIFLLTHNKADGFLELTPFHSNPFDIFFTCYTYLGDGIFILSLAVILAVVKRKMLAAGIFLSYCLSGFVAQILKNAFPAPRPAIYFKSLGRFVYSIPHVTLTASQASFPSGHSASAFALLGILLLLYPKNKWNFLFIFLALLVGYSRMYLSNHFLLDVLGGATIGIFTGMLAYVLLQKILSAKPQWFLVK